MTGDLDLNSSRGLQSAVGSAVNGSRSRVEIDLSGVSFIDSTGLRALLDCHAQLATAGDTLVLCNPSPIVIRLFELTSVGDVFESDGTSPH